MYYPTRWDFSTFFGTIGLFLALMFLFVRVLPAIAMFEMKTLTPDAKVKEPADGLTARDRSDTELAASTACWPSTARRRS